MSNCAGNQSWGENLLLSLELGKMVELKSKVLAKGTDSYSSASSKCPTGFSFFLRSNSRSTR